MKPKVKESAKDPIDTQEETCSEGDTDSLCQSIFSILNFKNIPHKGLRNIQQ